MNQEQLSSIVAFVIFFFLVILPVSAFLCGKLGVLGRYRALKYIKAKEFESNGKEEQRASTGVGSSPGQ